MRRDKTSEVVLIILGIPVVVWLALLVAPAFSGGRESLLTGLGYALEHPASMQIVEDSAKFAALALVAYAFGIGIYYSTKRNWRRREEHGSASWGEVRSIAPRYRSRNYFDDRLLTAHFRMSYNAKKHRRNLNTLVIGGSGAGKTRGYSLVNTMQANTSLVVLDPKGEIVRNTGHLLEAQGYEVRVLDLVDMARSHCYNPFSYIDTDNDAQRLSTNLFKATTPKGATSQDPFWDTAAGMLHLALMFYLMHKAPPEEQNYPMLMELLRAGEVREDDEEYVSVLDELFDRLEMEEPDHIALRYYRDYRSGSAKTLKSIQVTLAARLEKFNLASLASLTATDELDLSSIGEKKVALFAVIPDNDTSFNFLVSILYTQLFQQLFSLADTKYAGSLPMHVHFLMDEFANVSLPDDFQKILSVMRSRNISASILLQNLAQLKALFEKDWESIVGNCDEFVYLGGNEQSTHKYVSELLGKETIDTNTFGRSSGRNGNYTTNWQVSGRELLTPDEVRMLDNKLSLLFIRGEKPICDDKCDISKHPRVKLTAEGGAAPFVHGADTLSVAHVTRCATTPTSTPTIPPTSNCEVLSDEEIEELFHLAA